MIIPTDTMMISSIEYQSTLRVSVVVYHDEGGFFAIIILKCVNVMLIVCCWKHF